MWTPLTETILNQVLNAGELASVTRDRAQVQPDPIPGILAETAATIRSRIASGGRTRLQGSPDCIPAELMAGSRGHCPLPRPGPVCPGHDGRAESGVAARQ